MENQAEKVYVAVGADWYDGFTTLQWALKKWSNDEISIVILHAANTICKDYVYTPIGKLPTSSVNEEKVKVLERIEDANRDKILSQYIAACGEVKAEVMQIENSDQEPLHKQILEIISSFRITKLVLSLGFMKYSSWKSRTRTATNSSFYVVRHKPEFCDLFVICGGRLVFLRGENDEEGYIEDDRGSILAKLKEKNYSIRNWLGKIVWPEDGVNYSNNPPDSPSSSRSHDSTQQWEKIGLEIEHYANKLLSLHKEEGEFDGANAILKEYSTELCIPENMDAAERIHALKTRIQNARDMIEFNRKHTNVAKERREKAKWAISICNTRAEELEDNLNEEIAKAADLNKEIESRKEEIYELECEVEQKRSKLSSILELQNELTSKLHMSSSARARAEAQLEKAAQARAEMIEEIEKLRKQRVILQRRIEFCKEKDAIGEVSKSIGLGFDFREFSGAEIKEATQDFSEHLRLKSGGRSTDVWKGRINHIMVAVKIYNSANEESLASKVKLLNQIRHLNVLAAIGFCTELNCIVYEHAHNGTLSDALFSTGQGSKNKNPGLTWYDRIRIAAEICSALGYLHRVKPKPIIHGNLKPSKILLDRNNIVKINCLRDPWSHYELGIKLDVRAFGKLVVQLLTGENWSDTTDNAGLDQSAGPWPMDLAMELCSIAKKCLSDEGMAKMPTREINDVRKRADSVAADGESSATVAEESADVGDLSNVPSAFICPIYQDVMRNPHLAADGFSYELEAIDEWLKTGHDTSPVTNLRLTHKLLTPNHTLRSVIQDWQNKGPSSNN
ncbi:U-box domain-containing protein kinase family protein [Striga asiatica]|uniref:RING-type E3 ubiquitin transferase n=1 Tax=Striga asiatica TaxID=4170 RepID=A0A5A7PPD8_STRAF|nr:U-box domain-containing protein kinase family protein [Striga asiatica]